MGDSEVINLASVESALKAALESDEKYQRENDAKFRAIRQNVSSYEEFRDIVLASHLKPLDRKSIASAPRKQPWNSVFSATQQKGKDYSEVTECVTCESQPKTATEFQRHWRRLGQSSKEKYDFLMSLGGPALRHIFRVEIGSGLLGDFLSVMAECLQAGDEVVAIAVLKGLSQTDRFSLALSFLDQAERGRCLELFHKLLGTTVRRGVDGPREEGVHGCEKASEVEVEEQHKASRGTEAAEKESFMGELKGLMLLYDITLDRPH